MNGMDMLRVGVYSGSFAPVHKGHVASAKAFMEQMKLDYLFIVPTYMDNTDGANDPLYRLKMCELAFSDVDGVVISDAEIGKSGRSYIFDTLSELKRPDARLFLLCETDSVLSFDSLYRYEDILKLCYPSYVRWENDPIITKRIVAKIGEYYEKYGVMFRRIVLDPIPISSAAVRRAAREGRDLSELVPAAVEKFIKDNRLYLD